MRDEFERKTQLGGDGAGDGDGDGAGAGAGAGADGDGDGDVAGDAPLVVGREVNDAAGGEAE
eukprot:CAMPEP_0119534430 /NCGR_PEP_ID=MMETSP1344-20130328/47650_1 /TAXON_ID=236787 /ORGANISM="Florenciella parvula, Strain CCMP2471" /LENGTH=61 /DNA_ID=CAMNT_0007575679 /DNA_START=390 /DNA_END=573 /DNA_ORIENTATION=+